MTMLRSLLKQRRSRPDGFIVVAVLWILVALATLATVYAVYVRNTAAALLVHDERVQAEALVTAALELVAYRITASAITPSIETRTEPQTAIPAPPPMRGNFSFRLGRANVAVDFRAENARIDLNAAPKALLAGLFTVLGARADLAETYADRIIAWRSPPRSESVDDEISAYKTAGLPYGPRLAAFPHPGELSLVLGLPPALVERAMPLVTVYSGQAQVNLFDARPEVIASLPGMGPDRLHDLLALRQAPQQNAADMMAALGPARPLATMAGGKSVRIAVRVAFENGRQTASEVVILLNDSGTEPYNVLSWRDEIDDVPQGTSPRAAR
jgi:general secretion pathway protein K